MGELVTRFGAGRSRRLHHLVKRPRIVYINLQYISIISFNMFRGTLLAQSAPERTQFVFAVTVLPKREKENLRREALCIPQES
ncbi:MAG: hypothetical protein ABI791_01530 [Acidobacteriota bacterium]